MMIHHMIWNGSVDCSDHLGWIRTGSGGYGDLGIRKKKTNISVDVNLLMYKYIVLYGKCSRFTYLMQPKNPLTDLNIRSVSVLSVRQVKEMGLCQFKSRLECICLPNSVK